MKQLFTILTLFFTGMAFSANAQAPINDDCARATVISTSAYQLTCSTSVSASTLNATSSTPNTCIGAVDDDIWYQFTPKSSSIIFRYANAVNTVTGGQTVPGFALYRQCPTIPDYFFCMAANPTGSGYRIVTGLTPGDTYYLRIWSTFASVVMEIDFCIQDVPPPPANDDCIGAEQVATQPAGTVCNLKQPASTVGATASLFPPVCNTSSANDDIWYKFTANTNAVSVQFDNARLSTSTGSANVAFDVYRAPCPQYSTGLVCIGNAGSLNGAVTVKGLTPGESYYIRFFSLSENNYMNFEFCLVDVNIAGNDECENAIALETYDYRDADITPVRLSTAGGTASANEPTCASVFADDDVWYEFEASTASIVIGLSNVMLNEKPQPGTAGIALYESSCPTSSSAFYCNTLASATEERIINGLTPGRRYYMRLWSTLTNGYTISADAYILNVPPAPNDECANAIPITLQENDSACSTTRHATTVGATQSSPDPSCASGFNDDDIWYSFVATSDAVRINVSNVAFDGNTGTSFLGAALHRGDCSSPVEVACQANLTSSGGSLLVNGLIPGETYLLRFFGYATGAYAQFDFCVANAGLPPNDECVNATTILAGSGFCTSPVTGTFRNATTSPGMTVPSCAPAATGQDVWFRTTVPASGNLVVQTSVLGDYPVEDLVLEVYTGGCDALTLITCDDDGNPEPLPNDLHPRISLTGRTPGEQVYIRVVKKFPLNYGEFAICAWDPTVLVPIANGGSCVPSGPLVIDAANSNNNMWVPLMDGSKNIIAEINARGANLGAIDASLFVNTNGTVRDVNGHYYLDRNLSINPENAGGARIRLYIKNEEFQALQAVDAAVTGVSSLKINKTNAPCGPVFAGTGSTALQDASGSYGADHYIEFSIPSFSGFFVDGGQSALPLEFVSFKATKNNDAIDLEWIVVQDATIEKFDIQRSNDGISFADISEQHQNQFISSANNNWQYKFRDETASGNVFYRIKMSDVNGKQVYSKVIAVNAGAAYTGPVSIYPNPVYNYCVVRMPVSVTRASLTLHNGAGMVVKQIPQQLISNGLYTLDMRNEPPGIYFLQVRHSGGQFQFKVIKR